MGDAAERDSFEQVFMALFGASLFAALAVTIGLWAGFVWAFFWLILLVVLAFALVIALPLYLIASALGRFNLWNAAGAGLIAGTSLPAFLMWDIPGGLSTRGIAAIAGFGGCGAAAGLVFLLLLRWPRLTRSRRAMFGGTATLVSALAFSASWIAQDHSCHNPVWYGQGISPSASFRIKLPEHEWRSVAAEVERFAKAHHWSLLHEATNTPDRPWFAVSACRVDGTNIQVDDRSDQSFEAYVYQPQAGDSWKQPMRDLHARMRARWPNSIDYRDEFGKPTAKAPDWLVSPKPSSTAR